MTQMQVTLIDCMDNDSNAANTAVTLRIKAPIDVYVQCTKYKFGLTEDELSRYCIKGEPELFVPTFRHAHDTDVTTFDMPVFSLDGSLEHMRKMGSVDIEQYYTRLAGKCITTYKWAVMPIEDGGWGLAPEQARLILPLGVMVEWVWTGSLSAFVKFCKLCSDPCTQKEIQELSHMISNITKPLFPVLWVALARKIDD